MPPVTPLWQLRPHPGIEQNPRCDHNIVYYGWRPNLRDEADNYLIELAVAGGADCLITKNLRDFSGAELQFPGLKVQSPESFLEEVRRCQH